jgi:hypothetical protein
MRLTDTGVPGHRVRSRRSGGKRSTSLGFGETAKIFPSGSQGLLNIDEPGTLGVIGEAGLGAGPDPERVVTGKTVEGSVIANVLADEGVLGNAGLGSGVVDVRQEGRAVYVSYADEV